MMVKKLGRRLHKKQIEDKLLIGRYEWCQLPKLHIPAIKTKIDTGAQTSAIHAFNIKPFMRKGHDYVHFDVHPLQASKKLTVRCTAPIIDERFIMSSNGHKEHRFVIATRLHMGDHQWEIEVTLSNRDPLRFRMLLGREALNHRVIIDPSMMYCQGKINKQTLKSLYRLHYR